MLIRPSLKFVKLGYVFCLLLAIAIGVYMLTAQPPVEYAAYAFVLPGILVFFVLIRHIQKRVSKVTVTDDRVREEIGLLSKATRTIELVKIQEVTVHRTVMQRIFGIGDLSMQTAGASSDVVIHSIDRPQEAADHILELARAQRGTATDPGASHGTP